MIDQASELRKLVLQSVRQQVANSGPAPRLIAVTAGKGGVGVSTIAVNLSVALAEHGARVVVVDADLSRSDVAALCGLPETQAVHDVMVARRDIHEVLQRGPAGIQVVPGLFAPGYETQWGEIAQQRLLRQFSTLGRHADVVILDVGGENNGFLRRCCQAADDVLMVTSTEPLAIMDTYARIKTSLSDPGAASRLQLVVNRCSQHEEGHDVHIRIDQSCRRFLGQPVQLLATIPSDPEVAEAATQAVPFVVRAPASHAAEAVDQMATALLNRPARPPVNRRDVA